MKHTYRGMTLVSAAVLAAACSRSSASPSDGLQTDAALASSLQSGVPSRPSSSVDGDAIACRPATRPAAASRARQAQADVQLQLAAEARAAGDVRGARDALRRAAELDAADDGIAYRLARTSEELGDAAAAAKEYCRYLTLAPSAADSAIVRQRLAVLSSYANARPATRPTTSVVRRAANRSSRLAARRSVASTVAMSSNGAVAPDRRTAPIPEREMPAITPPPVPADERGQVATTESGQSAAVPTPARTEPSPTPRTVPTPSTGTARRVVIGAAVGAILGTAADRSVRGAVIGAAAGGLLGSVAGGRQVRYRTTF